MARYRLTIEYDGTPFLGWQRQPIGLTVQGVIEDAVVAFQRTPVRVFGAGRTDTGVHALGQVAHMDLDRPHDAFRVGEALNHFLKPHPVAIVKCVEVADGFDARFSALRRHYLYRILPRRAPPTLDRDHVWWLPLELDVAAMADAAREFIGHHDFTTFRATQCQAATAVRTLDSFEVSREGDEIHCRVASRAFLHNQVRSMVGSLKFVGEGKWTRQSVAKALAAKDRTACGVVAPPEGLCLMHVDYPERLNAQNIQTAADVDEDGIE